MRFFHTTTEQAAESILSGGFRDASGGYGLASTVLTGVFVSNRPTSVSDGASGDVVLSVDLPDDLDVAEWAIDEVGHPIWEWCIPAVVINERGSLSRYEEPEEPVTPTDGPIRLPRRRRNQQVDE